MEYKSKIIIFKKGSKVLHVDVTPLPHLRLSQLRHQVGVLSIKGMEWLLGDVEVEVVGDYSPELFKETKEKYFKKPENKKTDGKRKKNL